MEEATILRWLKAEGETVHKDEMLLEIETDKAVMELPSPADGTLLRIAVAEGAVRVEEIVAWIGQPGEEAGLEH
jgi:pyruvate/2-oxoglutarate dehydrogenase complex dihydrolipoamide acyltransferase (E2) component